MYTTIKKLHIAMGTRGWSITPGRARFAARPVWFEPISRYSAFAHGLARDSNSGAGELAVVEELVHFSTVRLIVVLLRLVFVI
jgi:hypothetical protein